MTFESRPVWLLLILLALMVLPADMSEEPLIRSNGDEHNKENGMRREVVDAITNRSKFDYMIRQSDVYHSTLWECYKNSSSSDQRSQIAKEISEAVKDMAYAQRTIISVGLLLFGPRKYRSYLRSVRDRELSVVDDRNCLISTLELFVRHCGLRTEHGLKHLQFLANMCNYVVEKTAVKEAFMAACGVNNVIVSKAEKSDEIASNPETLGWNSTRWDVIESIVNNTDLGYTFKLPLRDIYRFNLWYSFKTSIRSRSPDYLSKVRPPLERISYVNSAVDMAGVILFGPEKARSTLLSKPIEVEDKQCFESSFVLFKKHCGGRLESESISHLRSFKNMCAYVADKTKIEEAFILSCGGSNNKSEVIDAENRRIEITPAPMHGSSDYCGRVLVNGISRMQILSYAKGFRLLLSPPPLIKDEWYSKIHVCFHRNATLGLCQCDNNDWISIQGRLWSSRISAYENRFVDVRFHPGAAGDVMVEYDEVSPIARYALLISGSVILFMAPIISKDFFPGVNSRGAQFTKWAMLLFGSTSIFLSSIDTTLAIVATGSCLALYYMIFSIIWRDER